ncbi:hypothetical protein BS333_19615 [Vibrio azureus]|uniref:Uncharacterized protein n=2 Tax=Vibrio azureus TaxID=512649 RepID=U3ATF4_9VIBR|nr:hypothetical protein [Vibrio azureus]AUI88522.1 hypothetical protein BS333_19615 [Vibrio azureus]GAD77045.1 hypothetical protein VAZ01S_059_00040 [Vibrio azureus NBRC 104587]
MNYYHLECAFIDDEASFSFDQDVKKIVSTIELGIKYYDIPPIVRVDQVYKQRAMSDVLKAIGFIPHRRVVDEFLKQYISGIQFIPVTVDVDGVQYDEYSFMNVFNTYSLLNEKASGASDFNVFRNAYNSIRKMAFCKDKLSKVTIRHDAFRVKEFPREIVITQKVKDILDANQVTGLICIPVEVK